MKTIIVNKQTITPSKIICVGRNYVEHIQELGNEIPDEMIVFFKPNSAISTTLHAEHNHDVLHFEGELCFVYQAGRFSTIGFGLDLTKRTVQNTLKAQGLPWERAKAFDGAALFSEFVSIEDHNEAFYLSLSINNQPQQAGGTTHMMYKPSDILAQLRTFITLEDGDIVMTGTPKGVGVIHAGDQFIAEVLNADKTQVLVSQQWSAE